MPLHTRAEVVASLVVLGLTPASTPTSSQHLDSRLPTGSLSASGPAISSATPALVLATHTSTHSTAATPGIPTNVSGTAGPGRVSVSFTPADARATSFTVTAWKGGTAATAATGTASPILVWGLSSGSSYTFTVTASNSGGFSAPSQHSAPVKPTGPVTNKATVAPDRTLVNQSTSFISSAGTNSSRRPMASESPSTSLYSPSSQGVPAGMEWRMLWLRASNCEPGPRQVEFFVQQEVPTSTTVRKFVQGDDWRAGQANRMVGVYVAGSGGELSWVEDATDPFIVSAGQSIGARWYGMTGGYSGCNWQFGAVQRPAGTGAASAATALPTATVGGSFKADTKGVRASWRTVPPGSYWVPESVRATNCETSGARHMEVVLLGPGNITHGVLTTARDGSGPVPVPAGGTFTWTASPSRPRLLLPEGWALGVRWTGMAGDAPTATCSWSATVSMGAMGGGATSFDSTMK